jgi:Chain length determinant protein
MVAPSTTSTEAQPPVVLVGRLVSLRFILGALRRRRKVWLICAALGLLIGLSYHFVVPRSYSAYATLYLAQPPGTDPAVGISNDLALLQTTAVGQKAVDLLGERSLSPGALLGKSPGVVQSDNVLRLNASGPSKAEAVRRANALATGFLEFRSQRLQAQTSAANQALEKQIGSLQQQISQLTTTINQLGSTQSAELTKLVGEQSSDSSELTNLEQSVQQNQLASVAVTTGSRVVTPGTLVPASTVKLFALSGLSGLIGGLVVGVAYVAVQAVVSDRLRRRDEVASLLGAPVEMSVPPIDHPKRKPEAWIAQSAMKPSRQLGAMANYLSRCAVAEGDRITLLVVALDDLTVPAAALAVLAKHLADSGQSVLVADMTSDGLLARGVGGLRVQRSSLAGAPEGDLHAVTAHPEEVSNMDTSPWTANESPARVVLTLAAVDPGKGAWHLGWANQAVVAVTAGRSSAQRVSSTAVLLRSAGVMIRSGVLIGADAQDESIGLIQSESPLVALPAAEGIVPR